jgi:hypothetical protein
MKQQQQNTMNIVMREWDLRNKQTTKIHSIHPVPRNDDDNNTTTKRQSTREEKKKHKNNIPNLAFLHMFNILIISRWCLHLKRHGLGVYETLRDNRAHFSGKVAKMCGRAVGNDHKLLSRYRSLCLVLRSRDSLLAVLCVYFGWNFSSVSYKHFESFSRSLLAFCSAGAMLNGFWLWWKKEVKF